MPNGGHHFRLSNVSLDLNRVLNSVNALTMNFEQTLKDNCACVDEVDCKSVKDVQPTVTNLDELSWDHLPR